MCVTSSFKGRDDLESFQLEISGFLKEMACPYSVLISGDIKERLTKKDDCLKLLCKLSPLGGWNTHVQHIFVIFRSEFIHFVYWDFRYLAYWKGFCIWLKVLHCLRHSDINSLTLPAHSNTDSTVSKSLRLCFLWCFSKFSFACPILDIYDEMANSVISEVFFF